MDPKRFPVTREGYERLVKELEHLKEDERPRIIASVAEARSHGDLRENAAYDAARHDQAMLEKKISELEQMLKNHIIIEHDPATAGTVRLGSTVVVEIEGDEERYTIVGALEAKPTEGLISNESPVGKALLGKRVGDDAIVASPRGSSIYKVIGIEN